MNQLYYGDNLGIMVNMPKQSVDLIYTDPPFYSQRNYGAFNDSWPGLRAYICFIEERLECMKPILKPDGSIYLHCTPAVSHYIKIMMDRIFGRENFRNEIVWCYKGGRATKKDFAKKHDIILRYGMSENISFNIDAVRIPYSEIVSKANPSRYNKSYRANKVYEGYTLNKKGKHPEDWWTIQPLTPSSNERLGYPKQKPITLLNRIIKASSNEGDTILDPFVGSGTTLYAAHLLNRIWIGIDKASESIELIRNTFEDRYKITEVRDYEVIDAST